MQKKVKNTSQNYAEEMLIWHKWDRLKRSDVLMPSTLLHMPRQSKSLNKRTISSSFSSPIPKQTVNFNSTNSHRFLVLGRRGDTPKQVSDSDNLVRFPPMEKLFQELKQRCAQKDYRLSFGREMIKRNNKSPKKVVLKSEIDEWSDSSTDCSIDFDKKDSDPTSTQEESHSVSTTEQSEETVWNGPLVNGHLEKSFITQKDGQKQKDSRVTHLHYISQIQEILANKNKSSSSEPNPVVTPNASHNSAPRISINNPILECHSDIPDKKTPRALQTSLRYPHSDTKSPMQEKKTPKLTNIEIQFPEEATNSNSDDDSDEETIDDLRNYRNSSLRRSKEEFNNSTSTQYTQQQSKNRLPDVITSNVLGEPSGLSCSGKQISSLTSTNLNKQTWKSRGTGYKYGGNKSFRKTKTKESTPPKFFYKDRAKYPYPEPQSDAPTAFLIRISELAHNVNETVRFEKNKMAAMHKRKHCSYNC